MPKRIPEADLAAILEIIESQANGASLRDITTALKPQLAPRTLQYRLKYLVDAGRLVKEGEGAAGRNTVCPAAQEQPREVVAAAKPAAEEEAAVPLSRQQSEIRRYLEQPLAARKPVGYNREFLDSYRPNETFYLSEEQRAHLAQVGKPNFDEQAAGTYAKQILTRLLIDLSWNSSRLEGNTYSLLDTTRLIELGRSRRRPGPPRSADDRQPQGCDRIPCRRGGGNRVQPLHDPQPSRDTGAKPSARSGRARPAAPYWCRDREVHVSSSGDAATDRGVLQPAAGDSGSNQDPFEQALFAMVQLPYLQPFDDVNKRVSRLAANIPFIKRNLSPLSFTDVPRTLYTDAILGVYELNKVDLLRDVFIWAYERSAARYAAVRQSLGEPDPFRFKHRAALRQIVGEVVRGRMDKKAAAGIFAAWVEKNDIPETDREKFRDMAETEALSLHEGNFARYQIRPSEFEAWQQVWKESM